MSDLQVLVATMNQNDNALCEKMNLNSNALIINQSNRVDYEKFNYNGYEIEKYTFNERGLSKSRNNALMRCTGDIICIADDDMIYTDTYKEDIIHEFEKHPEADAILFYVEAINGKRPRPPINKFGRISKRDYRFYCSVNIAIRRERLLYKNIYFNILFGSGSVYNCGEDTIFLKDLIDNHLKIYKSPIKIAEVDMSDSTWFKGYNEQFFKTKGAVIAATYPKISCFVIFIQSVKNSISKMGSICYFKKLYQWYTLGLKEYRNNSK